MPKAYYNEIDPFAAAWLRELIKAGHIAPGDVDERSIEDVTPGDLAGFTQCHFFAGIGVWSYALRQAGWPDSRPVWTGSCPCQPFSQAGKRKGFADERHLWPAFFWLIQQRAPGVIFGEQVASKDGLAWIDIVQTDLEAAGYTTAAIDFCAAGVGAPHIRQRLYWVGHATGDIGNVRPELEGHRWESNPEQTRLGCIAGRMADTNGNRRCQGERHNPPTRHGHSPASEGDTCSMADTNGQRLQGGHAWRPDTQRQAVNGQPRCDSAACRPAPVNGFWSEADWLYCRDGKWRPVQPSTFPLANVSPARVGRLRGYGNAINAETAKAFIEAYMGIV